MSRYIYFYYDNFDYYYYHFFSGFIVCHLFSFAFFYFLDCYFLVMFSEFPSFSFTCWKALEHVSILIVGDSQFLVPSHTDPCPSSNTPGPLQPQGPHTAGPNPSFPLHSLFTNIQLFAVPVFF